MEHTKGPWTFSRYGNYAADIIGENRSIAIVNKQQNPTHDDAEGKANARLIAAAPDLLEACKMALNGGIDQGFTWEEVCDRLHAAVETAEGGDK